MLGDVRERLTLQVQTLSLRNHLVSVATYLCIDCLTSNDIGMPNMVSHKSISKET